jgi:hypothetical protein
MQFYQSAETLVLTGLTKSQLREWCTVRALLEPDVPADGPGRHAMFAWHSILALRLLKSIREDWAGEVARWAGAVRHFRESIRGVPFPALWGSVVIFEDLYSSRLVKVSGHDFGHPSLSMPLDPHLLVLASRMAITPPDQLSLFLPSAVTRK